VWRRILAWLGWSRAAARADAVAARHERGAWGEQETARLLAVLETQGWHVWHDLMLAGYRANIDHVLVSPCGTAVVVADSKVWHRGRTTQLVGGRVHCGVEDRHEQVDAVARYAQRVAVALGMPAGAVWPVLVVHGSPVPGGRLEARAAGWAGRVQMLSAGLLVSTLARSVRGRDQRAAAALAGRVDRVLRPYEERGGR
jgi:acyl-coenzyme A thioesterase PaaI-like protein